MTVRISGKTDVITMTFVFLCFWSFFIPPSVEAAEPGGVTIGGTRLIYPGAKKEASLSVTNSDTAPYLIQSWIEPLEGGTERVPFIITPPLFRLEGKEQNLLRVVRTGGSFPENRESMFWLNVKSIPASEPKGGDSVLQIAVRTRIKLIYRPEGVKGIPEEVVDKLVWTLNGTKLTVSNPTPFYMNFQEVRVGSHTVKDATYVQPQGEMVYFLPAGASGAVTWKLISDYGGTGEEHSSVPKSS